LIKQKLSVLTFITVSFFHPLLLCSKQNKLVKRHLLSGFIDHAKWVARRRSANQIMLYREAVINVAINIRYVIFGAINLVLISSLNLKGRFRKNFEYIDAVNDRGLSPSTLEIVTRPTLLCFITRPESTNGHIYSKFLRKRPFKFKLLINTRLIAPKITYRMLIATLITASL
jgi:hypothetical protein